MKRFKFGLLPRVVTAILLGVLLGAVVPQWCVRVMLTFNSLFSNLLQFLIPLIIIGLVTPAIADIGKGAGRLLFLTVVIAYGDTVFAGYFSYFTSAGLFPKLITAGTGLQQVQDTVSLEPYFTVAIPAMVDVMSALVFSFVVGLGIAHFSSAALKDVFSEFKEIIAKTIEKIIIPLLPVYIFGMFLNMSFSGQAMRMVQLFVEIIGVIFAMHILLLLLQFCLAGALTHRNPFRLLLNMMPAYFTALGTSSSAATIPVTLRQTLKNDVEEDVAGFVVPLCATIHLSGSAMKITACAVALMLMQGIPFDAGLFTGFILMLGVMMVAAPGVPGGAIMAALGVLSSVLGFDAAQQALMIALYITMDSFGTACNVTGDGAIAVVVNKIKTFNSKELKTEDR
ncbi:MAG: dicarboxylate/amino acid:cation symporter [Muribaculaceae bacterium]|nr:dicarboxylate/amino acid:cation symporter [Muribaculaceae bacterium]